MSFRYIGSMPLVEYKRLSEIAGKTRGGTLVNGAIQSEYEISLRNGSAFDTLPQPGIPVDGEVGVYRLEK